MIKYNQLKYLVTGTGRCGTVSVSRLLTNAGIPCGHESVFDSQGIDGAIKRLKEGTFKQSYTSARDGWKQPSLIQADSSYMAVPFLGFSLLKNTQIIHLVRNPLEVISSFVYGVKHFQDNPIVKEWDNFIESHLPTILDFETPIERAIHFYIEWNKMIKADIFHRIEDGSTVLLNKLSISSDNMYEEKANSFHRKETLTLNDIPETIRKDLIDLALQYGYDL